MFYSFSLSILIVAVTKARWKLMDANRPYSRCGFCRDVVTPDGETNLNRFVQFLKAVNCNFAVCQQSCGLITGVIWLLEHDTLIPWTTTSSCFDWITAWKFHLFSFCSRLCCASFLLGFDSGREQEGQHPGQPEQHQRHHHRGHLLHRPPPPHRLRHRPNQAAAQKVHPAARGLWPHHVPGGLWAASLRALHLKERRRCHRRLCRPCRPGGGLWELPRPPPRLLTLHPRPPLWLLPQPRLCPLVPAVSEWAREPRQLEHPGLGGRRAAHGPPAATHGSAPPAARQRKPQEHHGDEAQLLAGGGGQWLWPRRRSGRSSHHQPSPFTPRKGGPAVSIHWFLRREQSSSCSVAWHACVLPCFLLFWLCPSWHYYFRAL